jgi:phosphatidate cytidylyltransferase
MKRLLTAAAAVPILLYAIWAESPLLFSLIAAAAVVLGVLELYGFAEKLGYQAYKLAGCIVAIAIQACFFAARLDWIAGLLSVLTVFSLSMAIAHPESMDKALASCASTILAVVYVALLGGFLIGLKMTPETLTSPPIQRLAPKLLTMFFAIVMMTDTGAYYTGRAIGRHKLAFRISPGKTVEGSIGGLATAMIVGPLCRVIFFPELPLLHAVALGGLMGLVGQIGDLAESLLKRGAGVKDSGRLLPGHGGMLDRLDSILFCAPIVYYYSRLFLHQ